VSRRGGGGGTTERLKEESARGYFINVEAKGGRGKQTRWKRKIRRKEKFERSISGKLSRGRSFAREKSGRKRRAAKIN